MLDKEKLFSANWDLSQVFYDATVDTPQVRYELIKIAANDKTFLGQGRSVDTVMAGAERMLKWINENVPKQFIPKANG